MMLTRKTSDKGTGAGQAKLYRWEERAGRRRDIFSRGTLCSMNSEVLLQLPLATRLRLLGFIVLNLPQNDGAEW